MRVAFLVAELGRSGGMAVIRDRARHLREHAGAACTLVVCDPGAREPGAEDGDVPVRRLEDVAGEPVDVAIATWWTTAECLWELPARQRAVLLQSLDSRYYREAEHADRLGAEAVLDLPVHYLVVSEQLRRSLAELRPEAPARLVPPGIDKTVFVPRGGDRREGPLRVLVEGQPSVWFKAVPEAVAAVRAMAEPATVTVVAADPAHADGIAADRVTGALSPSEMAALYAEHDVLLKLSRFEGLSLPVLEAFHAGTPCVVRPFGGAAELVEHGTNGLVVGFDDEPGTVAALERLARDGALLARLRDGALATAAAWPGREEALATFATAVSEIAAGPAPDADHAFRRLARSRRRAIEVQREAARRSQVELGAVRGEVEWWQDAWRQADARIAEYDRWTRELEARIERLQRRPGFRIEERLRRLGGRGG